MKIKLFKVSITMTVRIRVTRAMMIQTMMKLSAIRKPTIQTKSIKAHRKGIPKMRESIKITSQEANK